MPYLTIFLYVPVGEVVPAREGLRRPAVKIFRSFVHCRRSGSSKRRIKTDNHPKEQQSKESEKWFQQEKD